MLDCEFVNRFLAFYLLGTERYLMPVFLFFSAYWVEVPRIFSLHTPLNTLNQWASGASHPLHAFRKITANERYGMINKPLYDAVTVNLAKLSVQDCKNLLKKKEEVLKNWLKIFYLHITNHLLIPLEIIYRLHYVYSWHYLQQPFRL